MSDVMEVENPRAVLGGNFPPVELTPFEQSKIEIEDLFGEAKNFLDGEEITTKAQAEEIAKLMDLLRSAAGVADDRRKVETKPLDAAKAEIQTRYNALIENNKTASRYGLAHLAIDTCKKALAPYMAREAAAKEAAAAAARKEAEEKAAAAQAAIRASREADLETRQKAEAALAEAKRAEAAAKKAENDKVSIKGGSRAVSFRTSYEAAVTDEPAFAKIAWKEYRHEMSRFLAELAQRLVNSGRHEIDGVTVTTIRTPV